MLPTQITLATWWRHRMEIFSMLLALGGGGGGGGGGIHRSPVNFPHKGQCYGALMFSLFRARTNGWVNNRDAGDLRRYCVHYDVTVMIRRLHQVSQRHQSLMLIPNFRTCLLLLLLSRYFVVLNYHVYFCTMINHIWKLTYFYQTTLWGGSPDVWPEN